MSNIVTEVNREIVRVRSLWEKIPVDKQDAAARTIRFAELALQQCNIGDLYESLDDLKEITAP